MGEQDNKKDSEYGPRLSTAFSNGIRLTGRQWLAVGVITIIFVVLAPPVWKPFEPLSLEADHRMPHDLSNDYWLYERYAQLAAAKYDTLLIGDSVIWGEYVNRRQTLSHYLNEFTGQERCLNLGLDGAHPLALEGLIEHYAAVSGKTVLLHCNPLWMSSPRADLQDDKTTDFNHPRLVRQFLPKIPSYREEISPRLGVVVGRHLPLSRWTAHLQQAYYDRTDIPSWTLEHPYENPLRPPSRGLPAPDDSLRHPTQPWYESGISKQDYPWVDLETSLQWHAFQGVIQILKRRGNRVLVLVGPFNEHLLSPDSFKRYQAVKSSIIVRLEREQVPYVCPPALPSEEYGDASHPLAAGYARLARRLLEEPFFRQSDLAK